MFAHRAVSSLPRSTPLLRMRAVIPSLAPRALQGLCRTPAESGGPISRRGNRPVPGDRSGIPWIWTASRPARFLPGSGRSQARFPEQPAKDLDSQGVRPSPRPCRLLRKSRPGAPQSDGRAPGCAPRTVSERPEAKVEPPVLSASRPIFPFETVPPRVIPPYRTSSRKKASNLSDLKIFFAFSSLSARPGVSTGTRVQRSP